MATRQPGLQDESPSSQPYSVKGKTAIVTGAGSGINLAFATLLLSRGCSVILADLSLRPEAQRLLSTYPASSPPTTANTTTTTPPEPKPKAIFHHTDVTSWPSLTSLFTTALTHFPCIDIVCPGAGIYDPHVTNFWHPPGSPTSGDDENGGRYKSLDVNLVHPIRLTQMAISHFLNPAVNPPSAPGPSGVRIQKTSPTNPKRIILISSIAGQIPNFNTPIYVSAKHAINGFIRSLASLEPRLGIRVNGVAPGVIKTPLWTEHPEKLKFVDEKTDEWASAEEVAVAMLRCLEEGGLVGGTVLEVGKGQTRRVGAVMDPGPSGRGHSVSRLEEGFEEVYGWLGKEGWGVGKAKL